MSYVSQSQIEFRNKSRKLHLTIVLPRADNFCRIMLPREIVTYNDNLRPAIFCPNNAVHFTLAMSIEMDASETLLCFFLY